jgi:hypothetical protein
VTHVRTAVAKAMRLEIGRHLEEGECGLTTSVTDNIMTKIYTTYDYRLFLPILSFDNVVIKMMKIVS